MWHRPELNCHPTESSARGNRPRPPVSAAVNITSFCTLHKRTQQPISALAIRTCWVRNEYFFYIFVLFFVLLLVFALLSLSFVSFSSLFVFKFPVCTNCVVVPNVAQVACVLWLVLFFCAHGTSTPSALAGRDKVGGGRFRRCAKQIYTLTVTLTLMRSACMLPVSVKYSASEMTCIVPFLCR